MWEWLAENYVTLIAAGAVVLLIAGAAFVLIRDKKKGKSCCGDCAHCGGCCNRK